VEGSIEALLSVDRSVLSRDELLDHLAAVHALIGRCSAELERDLAALADRHDAKSLDREELGCLLRWSSGYTEARIVQAHKLVDDLPATLAALSTGAIGPEHARALAEACGSLDPAQSGRVEARVLPRAGQQTVTELKRALTRAVQAVDLRGWQLRHQHAARQRDVRLSVLPDGMAGLWSTHTLADADAILTAVQQLAARGRGDGRLAGERRTDALRDLILGPRPAAARPTPTKPAPRTAEPARRPVGPPTRYRYHPPRALREQITTRDRTCRFPGCTRTAASCEIDHVAPWNGTNTIETNLHALCPRHHHLKHETPWTVTRTPDGTTRWTSPARRSYAKPPPESDDDEPP
jgi:Domain of unknown function (DUF222)